MQTRLIIITLGYAVHVVRTRVRVDTRIGRNDTLGWVPQFRSVVRSLRAGNSEKKYNRFFGFSAGPIERATVSSGGINAHVNRRHRDYSLFAKHTCVSSKRLSDRTFPFKAKSFACAVARAREQMNIVRTSCCVDTGRARVFYLSAYTCTRKTVVPLPSPRY